MKALLFILVLSTSVYGQDKDSVYTYITQNYWDSTRAHLIGLYEIEELQKLGYSKNKLSYLVNRVARANRKKENYVKAKRLAEWLVDNNEGVYESLYYENFTLLALTHFDFYEFKASIDINRAVAEQSTDDRIKSFAWNDMYESWKNLYNQDSMKVALDSAFHYAEIDGTPRHKKRLVQNLAEYYTLTGNPEKAWAYLEEHGQPTTPEGRVNYLWVKGTYYQALNRFDAAEAEYKASVNLARTYRFEKWIDRGVTSVNQLPAIEKEYRDGWYATIISVFLGALFYSWRYYKKRTNPEKEKPDTSIDPLDFI